MLSLFTILTAGFLVRPTFAEHKYFVYLTIILNLFLCLLVLWITIPTQLGLKASNFEFGGTGEFGVDQNKTLPVEIFFPSKFPCGHNSLPHPTYTNHNCVNIGQKNCGQTTSNYFSYFFFSPVGPSIWDDIANNRSTPILRDICCLCP